MTEQITLMGIPLDAWEILHYGRKGMKWGQNIFTKGKGSRGGKRGKGEDVSTLSDATLKARVKRLELEKSYKRLQAEKASSERTAIQKGLAETQKIIANSVRASVQNQVNKAVSKHLDNAVQSTLSKYGGDKDN